MPDARPIQESFAYGAISPRLWNRPSSDRYQQAVGWCRNYQPLAHGPVASRDGARYVQSLPEDDPDILIVPVNYNVIQQAALVVGSIYVQLYDEFGEIKHGQFAAELVSNGLFDSGLVSWGESKEDPGSGIAWRPFERVLQLTSAGANPSQWVAAWQQVGLLNTAGVAHDLRFDMRVVFPVGAPQATYGEVRVGTTLLGTEIFTAPLVQGSDQSFSFTPPPTSPFVFLTFYVEPNGAVIHIDDVSVKQPSVAIARWPSPYGNYSRQILQWEQLPTEETLWLTHPNVQPHELTFNPATRLFDFAPIALTGQPGSWGGENWPAAVTFHQQRSWFGGSPQRPETINASQTGVYRNLTTGTDPTDGLEYTLARRGRIAWMKGAKNLIVGTENAEYVAESQGGALIPGDVDLRQQSSYGSVIGQAENIGDRVVYASGDRTKLRMITYEWTRDSWISVDLAWPSEHLTQGRIARIAFATDPDPVFLMTEQGSDRLLACSYDREQQIVGWADYRTEGRYLSVAVSSYLGTALIWTAVQRTLPNGQQAFYLEQMSPVFNIDSYVRRYVSTPTKTFTGLDHLEGHSVTPIILVGNTRAAHPPVTVENGAVTLQYEADAVIFGRAFESSMLTLPVASQNQALVNVASQRKRWSKIYLRSAGSIKPLAQGVDFFSTYTRLVSGELASSIVSLPSRSERYPATLMDTGESLRFEDIQIGGLGWSTASGVLVVQNVPLKTQVVGLFGEAGVGSVDGQQ